MQQIMRPSGVRPSGVRRCVVGCAVGLSVLLLAGVLPGAAGAAGAVGAVRSAGVSGGWNAESLPALGVSPGSGPLFVPLEGVVVPLRSMGVATSTVPTLEIDDVSVGAVRFQIESLVDGRVTLSPRVVVSNRVARWRVERGTLAARQAYRVAVLDDANQRTVVMAGRHLLVDLQRAAEQKLWSFAGVGATETTGEPVVSWASPGLSTLAGTAGFSLLWRPTNERQVGVPSHWELAPSSVGSRWKSLTLTRGGTVALLTAWDGWAVTFERSAAGVFVAELGVHDNWPAGMYATLNANTGGGWTVTNTNQIVTSFPAANVAQRVTVYPTGVWADGSPVLQQVWVDGRLDHVTDSVSKQQILFHYAPSPQCATPAAGFIEVPAGMLCASTLWSGARTTVSYVATGSGPQIGRLVSYAGEGMSAQVTDLGWDISGRIGRVRQPLATAATAAGVVDGLGENDPRAQSTLTYDPAGRVRTITAPAGLVSGGVQTPAQTVQPVQTLSYSTDRGQVTFQVQESGVNLPFVTRTVSDISTMDQTRATGPSGHSTITTYNQEDQATEVLDEVSGTRSRTVYDNQGRAVTAIGPSRRAMTTGSGAPVVETRYDTYDADPGARIRMEPITGLVGMVYNNTGFTGVPSDRSIGPRVNGRRVQTMAFGYNANPSGAGGVWSMRLAGKFIAPTEGTYQFRSTTDARLTINAMACTVQVPCRQQLRRNAAADIQAEIVSGTNGAANVSLEVAGADNRWQPIPAAQTAPGLNEVTEQETTDQLATGRGAERLKQISEYDLATGSTNLLKQTSSSGATVSHTWAENTGVDGQYGQHLTWTAPDGHTTYYGYHGATAQASGCDGPPANQGGQLAITTRPGAITTEQTYDAAGSTNKATGQGTETCINYRPDGSAESGAVTGDGPAYAVSSTPMLFNNPLVSSGTTTTQGVTNTATQSVSITGQLFQSTDNHGTITTHAYDPNTGHPTVTRTVTANGETRVYTYNYDRFGQPTSQAVNGKTLSTTTYRNDGTIANVRYKNGTTSAITLDANNNADSITYAGFTGGATISETNTFSRDNAILSRTLRGTDGTATTQATYNLDHRIISAVNTGTMALTTRSKTVAFEGQPGSNGNRTSQTTTKANNKQQTATFSYNEANQLTTTTQENIGTPTYDQHGRTTSIGNPTTGASTLSYDAGGHLIEATGPNGTIAFTGNGDTIYTPTPTEPPTTEEPPAEEPAPDTTEPAPTTTEPAADTTPEPAPTTEPKAGTETTTAKAGTEAAAAARRPGLEEGTEGRSPTDRMQRAAKAAPTGPITLRTSGNLLLDETGNIAGQIISLPQGVTVALDANSNPVEWLYNDLQGSTAWRTTGNTAPAHTTVYDPWGTQISTNTQPLPTTALELALYSNGWKGTGRLPIGEDFYTMGNREYSPQAGRFLQRDPLIGGSTNAYEYALGDPWNNTDPSGNMSIGKWVGLAVSVIASAVLSIATAGAYAAIAAATIGAAVKGYAASFAVGAVAGAVSGFASSTVEQAIDTGDIDWQRVGASVLIGGAIGGVAGAAQYGAVFANKATAASASADADPGIAFRKAGRSVTGGKKSSYFSSQGGGSRVAEAGSLRQIRADHVIDRMLAPDILVAAPAAPALPAVGFAELFTVTNVLITAGIGSIGGAAAWGTNLLVPTPTAGGVPTPVPPALDPSEGTVDVGSEGAALLDAAFG